MLKINAYLIILYNINYYSTITVLIKKVLDDSKTFHGGAYG